VVAEASERPPYRLRPVVYGPWILYHGGSKVSEQLHAYLLRAVPLARGRERKKRKRKKKEKEKEERRKTGGKEERRREAGHMDSL
jgi:hypothetical protein